MKQLERKITTTYRWWTLGGLVRPEHVEKLNELAVERIGQMTPDGYIEGELLAELFDDDELEISYRGHWETETEDIEG